MDSSFSFSCPAQVDSVAILLPFTAHFLYENHEKTYLAFAAFDNPRSDVCGCVNKGLVADQRNHN